MFTGFVAIFIFPTVKDGNISKWKKQEKYLNNGLLIPIIVKTRVRSYRLSDFSKTNEKKILKKIS